MLLSIFYLFVCYSLTYLFSDVTKIRLVNGLNASQGRVEVYVQGPNKWGTVCDDLWDDKDATVVCRYLGYAVGKARKRAAFGAGTGSIWYDNVKCKGDEKRLQDCENRGLGVHNCQHYEDAGVECSGKHLCQHMLIVQDYANIHRVLI